MVNSIKETARCDKVTSGNSNHPGILVTTGESAEKSSRKDAGQRARWRAQSFSKAKPLSSRLSEFFQCRHGLTNFLKHLEQHMETVNHSETGKKTKARAIRNSKVRLDSNQTTRSVVKKARP